MAQNVEKLHPDAATLAERASVLNDLSGFTAKDRMKYYMRVCETLGLNPLTGPFAYITLNGELKLYAKKDATDQLRRIYQISVKVTDRSVDDGIYTVSVQTSDPSGREDEDIGAVVMIYPQHYWEYDNRSKQRVRKAHPKAGKLFEGEDKANAMMKATTKAKRRATLSHCGLGFLDESEIVDIPANEVGGVYSAEEMHGERMGAEIKPFPANKDQGDAPPEPEGNLALENDPFFHQDNLQLRLEQDERFGDVNWTGFADRMVELIRNGSGQEGRLAKLRADNETHLLECKLLDVVAFHRIADAFKDARAKTPVA